MEEILQQPKKISKASVKAIIFAAFIIGRTLGREFANSLIGDKLKKYDDAIECNGFATVLYLRLVYFSVYTHEFRNGTDQGSIPNIFFKFIISYRKYC